MIYFLFLYAQYTYFRRILPSWTRRKCLHLAHMEARSIWMERYKWGVIFFLVNQYRWRRMWRRRWEETQ